MREFQNEKGQMIIGGVKATKIAERVRHSGHGHRRGSLEGELPRDIQGVQRHVPDPDQLRLQGQHQPALLRILQQEGSCIDAVSIGEVEACLKAGFAPDRILYTGVIVSDEEMQAGGRSEVPINVDSVEPDETAGRHEPPSTPYPSG